jgi:hypothetical protein
MSASTNWLDGKKRTWMLPFTTRNCTGSTIKLDQLSDEDQKDW